MVHVDPHTVKVIPAAAKRFMGAARYAVVGRTLNDPAKFDGKVLRWYLDRKMAVSPVRPPSDKYDNSKPVEGLKIIEKVVSSDFFRERGAEGVVMKIADNYSDRPPRPPQHLSLVHHLPQDWHRHASVALPLAP
jgi:hypothetical protein